MWVYFRWWCIARITFALPLPDYGGGSMPKVLAVCPLCDATRVGLEHILCHCQGTVESRNSVAADIDTTTMSTALPGCGEIEVLYKRVRYFGTCISVVIAALMGGS